MKAMTLTAYDKLQLAEVDVPQQDQERCSAGSNP